MSEPMPSAEAFCTVACPQCGAGYKVPVAKLAAKARKLKCAQCGHVWLATLPVAEAPAATAAPAETSQETTPPVVAAEAPSAPAPEAAPEAAPEVPAETPAEAPAGGPAEAPEAAAPIIAPLAVAEVLKPTWHAWIVGEQKWLTLAFVMAVLGLVGAGVSLWQQLPHSAAEEADTPHTRAVYVPKAVPAPPGVLLHEVEANAAQSPQGVVLNVQGRIANTGAEATVLPHLQAELVDDAGAVQDFWPIALITTTLPAQTEMPFAVSFTNPMGKGWRVVWVQ